MRARRVIESINFERGKDPKTVMDIGRTKYAFPVEDIIFRGGNVISPEEGDKYLRTVLPRRLKSVISRPGAVWNYPRFKDGLHYADAKWIMRQGYSGIKYKGTFYPFPKIEGFDFQRSGEEEIDESVNFERGKDPKKVLRLGRVRPYPDMTADQFRRWFKEEIVPYLDDDGEQAIVDNLLMNDWEADWEVAEYLRGRHLSPDIVDELMYMRGYFNDREYIKRLFDENLF